MFFPQHWSNLWRVGLTALLIYIFIIVAVQMAGKRATAKMNNFDWIVTIAMGATSASTILMQKVSFLEGAVAISVLMGMQFVLTKASTHFAWFNTLVRLPPALLFYDGNFLARNMRYERVSYSEIMGAIRARGFRDVEDVWAVVLESSGDLSVIGRQTASGMTALANVRTEFVSRSRTDIHKPNADRQ